MVDCRSEDMIGMLVGMNSKVEKREVAGVQPWKLPGIPRQFSSTQCFNYLLLQ